MQPIDKIHHLSAIVGDPQENLQFYRDVLGLRFVKQTVNYEDEHTYHLYYSNQTVDNGTIMTFFPWTNAHKGRVGSGQVGTIAFRIPQGSTPFWKAHLASHHIAVKETNLFLQPTLELQDSHDLALALVEADEVATTPAILGFHGSVLLSANPVATAQTLAQDLGLEAGSDSTTSYHFYTVGAAHHHIVVPKEALSVGRWGIGTVHHIAWSVPDAERQLAWHTYLSTQQYNVTDVKERNYFKALYFQEPGNILFELATEGPGFTLDEPLETLGNTLMLPVQFESRRAEISAHLPKFNLTKA